VRVCLIRHASTPWNEAGRIQGQTDIPLSPEGCRQVAGWQLPPGFAGAACIASPLRRARQTAGLLGFLEPEIDPRLAEMRWGSFEGCTLAELRAEHGPAMVEREAMGVDFRPPGGESPRLVAERLRACLRDLAGRSADHLLVTHKGVLRASLILALGWEMRGKPPVRYDPERALVFELDPSGAPTLVASWPLRAAES
jgi:broad specificity phosphatase PhoE